MASPVKARKQPANQPQKFNEILTPALPVAPAVSDSVLGNQRLMLPAALLLVSVLAGILAGLAIKESWATPTTLVSPGAIAADTMPKFDRISAASVIAASGVQTLQVTPDAMILQATGPIQLGSSINLAQPGLSAYDAQGSVGVASSR